MIQIFFTFWQGFVIQVLVSVGVIGDVGEWDSVHVADGLQDLLITFEMGRSLLHRYPSCLFCMYTDTTLFSTFQSSLQLHIATHFLTRTTYTISDATNDPAHQEGEVQSLPYQKQLSFSLIKTTTPSAVAPIWLMWSMNLQLFDSWIDQ